MFDKNDIQKLGYLENLPDYTIFKRRTPRRLFMPLKPKPIHNWHVEIKDKLMLLGDGFEAEILYVENNIVYTNKGIHELKGQMNIRLMDNEMVKLFNGKLSENFEEIVEIYKKAEQGEITIKSEIKNNAEHRQGSRDKERVFDSYKYKINNNTNDENNYKQFKYLAKDTNECIKYVGDTVKNVNEINSIRVVDSKDRKSPAYEIPRPKVFYKHKSDASTIFSTEPIRLLDKKCSEMSKIPTVQEYIKEHSIFNIKSDDFDDKNSPKDSGCSKTDKIKEDDKSKCLTFEIFYDNVNHNESKNSEEKIKECNYAEISHVNKQDELIYELYDHQYSELDENLFKTSFNLSKIAVDVKDLFDGYLQPNANGKNYNENEHNNKFTTEKNIKQIDNVLIDTDTIEIESPEKTTNEIMHDAQTKNEQCDKIPTIDNFNKENEVFKDDLTLNVSISNDLISLGKIFEFDEKPKQITDVNKLLNKTTDSIRQTSTKNIPLKDSNLNTNLNKSKTINCNNKTSTRNKQNLSAFSVKKRTMNCTLKAEDDHERILDNDNNKFKSVEKSDCLNSDHKSSNILEKQNKSVHASSKKPKNNKHSQSFTDSNKSDSDKQSNMPSFDKPINDNEYPRRKKIHLENSTVTGDVSTDQMIGTEYYDFYSKSENNETEEQMQKNSFSAFENSVEKKQSKPRRTPKKKFNRIDNIRNGINKKVSQSLLMIEGNKQKEARLSLPVANVSLDKSTLSNSKNKKTDSSSAPSRKRKRKRVTMPKNFKL